MDNSTPIPTPKIMQPLRPMLHAPHTPSPAILAKLTNLPLYHHLTSHPQTYIPIANPNRIPKPGTTEDSFIAETLATPTTITSWHDFFQYPPDSPSPNTSPSSSPSRLPGDSGEVPFFKFKTPEVLQSGHLISLITLSTHLSGHPHTLHGGMTSVLFDEFLGLVAQSHAPPNTSVYTAFLNTKFLRKVRVPGVVVGRAWMVGEKSGGRKFWVRGVIEVVGKEGDEEMVVVAEGEALMVAERRGGNGKRERL